MPMCECYESRKKFRDDIWWKRLSITNNPSSASKFRIGKGSQTRVKSTRTLQANGSGNGTLTARNGGDEKIVGIHGKTMSCSL